MSTPMSPRSRPRDQPLVKAKQAPETEGTSKGGGAEDEEEHPPVFPTKGRRSNDEYVLDEAR